MFEFLYPIYMIVEIFVLIFCIGLFACGYVYNGARGMIENALIPQSVLIESSDGKINRTGKIVLLVLTAIFLVPVNVVLIAIQIGVILFKALCKLFLLLFGEDKE